jgi:UDP-N-acetylglucosamine pyrophosphorylase
LDFLQSKVPKILLSNYEPVEWPEQPDLEWCPPGHGDLYASLAGSGLLRSLLDRGIRYLFVSNADNLGATVDSRLLRYFADSGLSFLMEVAERTAADRKGGHLARRQSTRRLLLRESAQCPPDEEAQFQDIQRHRFFNTNNLWVRLDHLAEELERHQGAFPLPLITNAKTVDPKNPSSPRVLQLEAAMGAAIECFERTAAMTVDRERFAPVKTTSDLLAVRSDAYAVTDDHRLVLAPTRAGRPPLIALDPEHYRLLHRFEEFFADGPPSLVHCDRLQVTGPVRFSAGVVCQGQVELTNRTGSMITLPAGTYRDTRRDWP